MCGCLKHTAMDSTTVDMDQLLRANLPEGALQTVHCSTDEDERLQAASAAAIEGRTSAPLLKQELRQHILLKRFEAGKPELKPDFQPAKKYELTAAEKLKKEKRKEQNRRAAKKCREKKKSQESSVQNKYKQTEQQNLQLHDQVKQLQEYKTSLKMWLLTHLTVCSVHLPFHEPPDQASAHRQPHQQQSQLQSQHMCQHQQLQHLQQPQVQQQQHQEYSLALPSAASTISETLAITSGVEDKEPSLGSQGFDTICSDLQNQDLRLDSQELDAVFRGLTAGQDNVTDDPHCASTATNPTAQQTSGPPHYLSSSMDSFPHQTQAAKTCSMTTALFPPSASTTVTATNLPLPTNVNELLQSDSYSSHAHLQAPSAGLPISSCPGPTDSIPDLPGFPFTMRRKRKSVDSVPQSGEGKSTQPKMMKSATSPHMVSFPTAEATFTSSGLVNSSSEPDRSTLGISQLNIPADSTSDAASSHHQPVQMNTSISVHRGLGPSSAPSPQSPCYFPFSAVTPPPRSSMTPQPSSPVTPPPYSCHSSGSTNPLPLLGDSSMAMGRGVADITPTGPDPLLEENAVESNSLIESLGQHLQSFLSSSHCEEDSECLSSRSFVDLFQDGFTSSQED